MRITSKGQVTIPAHIREKARFLPQTEVDFVLDADGSVRLVKAGQKGKRKPTRGEEVVRRLWGSATTTMTTDEIMALTRGE